MMTVAVYAGSFDPVTVGHVDVIERAAQVMDTVVVAVGINVSKKYMFTDTQRMAMVEAACAHMPNVRVVQMSGTLVDLVAHVGATCVVKGVRDGVDVAGEMSQAAVNRDVGGVETLFLPSRGELMHVSSTMVRELLTWGMDISRYVPAPVLAFIGENSK